MQGIAISASYSFSRSLVEHSCSSIAQFCHLLLHYHGLRGFQNNQSSFFRLCLVSQTEIEAIGEIGPHIFLQLSEKVVLSISDSALPNELVSGRDLHLGFR